MFTFAMPQSLPMAESEFFGFAQVVGEDGGTQTLGHGVLPGDGVVEVFVGDDVKDRGEGFFVDDFVMSLGFGDARGDVAAAGIFFPRQFFTAIKDLPAFGFQFGDGFLHRVNRGQIDQRPHQGAGFERVADGHLFVSGDESFGPFLLDGFVDDDPAGGGATLASRADGAKQNPARSQIKISGRSDDDGVVSAEFEQHFAKSVFGH